MLDYFSKVADYHRFYYDGTMTEDGFEEEDFEL